VGTSPERPPSDSQRACRREFTQGTKVLHDGPAEVPVRLRHGGVAGMQMASMRPVHALVTQSDSGPARLGGGGNVSRAARMNHGDIQQVGTMEQGKGHFNVGTRSLTAGRCNANKSVTGLRTRIATRVGGDASESFLPVVVPTRAAPAEAIATHGVVDVAALDVTTTKASGSGYMRIGAGCTKAEVATVDEVAIREAEIRGDWDGVQVSPRVPALDTEQARGMRWGVTSVEDFCSRALSECVRNGGTREPDLLGDSVS
jgi:hypothetical protein